MEIETKLELIRQSMAGELDVPVYEAIQEGDVQAQSPENATSPPEIPAAPVAPPASPSFSTSIYDKKGELVTPSTSGVGLNQTMGSRSGKMIQPGQYEDGGEKKKLNKGTNIKQLQNFLIKKGYDLGAGPGKAITKGVGNFGPKTRAALEDYNSKNNTTLASLAPRGFLPTPVKEMLKSVFMPDWMYKMQGDLDSSNLTYRQHNKLKELTDEALKNNKTRFDYSPDSKSQAYDDKGMSDLGNTASVFDLAKTLYSPAYNLKTTLGQADIIETPEYYDDDGNVVPSQRWINDVYDFNNSSASQNKNLSHFDRFKDIWNNSESLYTAARQFAKHYANPDGRDVMIRLKKKGGVR